MRLTAVACLFALAGAGQAQTWEKLIAPGLTYRMEVDLATPRVVHALRYSLGSTTKAMPELAGLTVYSESGSSRQTVGELVKKTGAVAGINADFFPYTGDPLGLMVREGELISTPRQKRSTFAWGKGGAWCSMCDCDLSCTANGTSIAFDGLNEQCGVNEVVLNTTVAGVAIGEKGRVLQVVLQIEPGHLSPSSSLRGTIVALKSDPRVTVAEGQAIITASGNKADLFKNLMVGDPITLRSRVTGMDWDKIEHAVGGGPTLVKDGKVAVDWDYQGFTAGFSLKRHPRSAVGRTKTGDLWFVSIDGRQVNSVGATLEEEAQIMQRLGCVDAINLDGGDSTTFNILGVNMNRPSDGQARPIANAVLFFGEKKPEPPATFTIKVPEPFTVGEATTVKVVDQDGKPIDNSEILWSAQGKAWIDQGGLLRSIEEGEAWVFALVRGQFLTAAVKVVAKP
jgi:exopolysaccharide biosynthesis protein